MPAGESGPQDQDQRTPRDPDGKTVPEQEYEEQAKSGEDPDVLLDVPVLNVEELNLELKDLRAHISLRADLADLVSVNVGVDAYLDEVKLEVKGIEAQALLKVRLDRVLDTFNKALETIDRNPGILGGRSRGEKDPGREADRTDGAASDGAASNLAPNASLLSETTDREGHTVMRSVDESGDLTDTTLDESGAVTEERVKGNIRDLPVEEERLDAEGRTVSRTRDDLGNVVEQTFDGQGNYLGPGVPEASDGESDDADTIEVTLAAEKKARDLGIDLADVEGTGSGGRILVKDVEGAAGRRT